MLFYIEADVGDRISGYAVPDGFTSRLDLVVRSAGETLLRFTTDEPRHALVSSGRHETGLCGFSVDTGLVPGLAEKADLEIVEAETGMLIYRRWLPRFIKKRLFRLETHLLPLYKLDSTLQDHFQYSATAIDRLGRETSTQIFLLNNFESSYISGRLLYKNYEYYADTVFSKVIIMHEPYDEMAERLLVLRNIEKIGTEIIGDRDALSLKPLINFAQQLPLGDAKALGRTMRRLPDDVAMLLTNPLVRQLTVATPNDMPRSDAVSAALDLLSTFQIVGLRSKPDDFVLAVSEWLDMDKAAIPDIKTIDSVYSLSQELRNAKYLAPLLEKDVFLYETVIRAFNNVTRPHH